MSACSQVGGMEAENYMLLKTTKLEVLIECNPTRERRHLQRIYILREARYMTLVVLLCAISKSYMRESMSLGLLMLWLGWALTPRHWLGFVWVWLQIFHAKPNPWNGDLAWLGFGLSPGFGQKIYPQGSGAQKVVQQEHDGGREGLISHAHQYELPK
ncbi:hypothetical protein B0H13DRAFT_1870014 [Mycena leptocephala]|nr:hypothetical protein B0H13DRAFT_1870014 [Mycena leptocephala]